MKLFIALILTTLMLASCGDDPVVQDNGKLNLNFKLKYGDQTLVMFDNYTYPDGKKLYFSRFSFFLSEIQLKGSAGYTQIHDISYHNLTNSHTGAANAALGYKYNMDGIKPGTYSAIKFSLGVPKASNDKTPADYDNNHILSNQAEYWGAWKSFIFTRTEGQIDLDGDGVTETGFGLHTGANEAFRTIELPASLTITENGTATLTIEIDLKKEFGTNPVYDIESNPQIHSMSQAPQVKELIDNLITGFKIP
ncbi:MAG: hypothetical protein IPN29_14070 [Saprospiraceae bacterium]|nr:hypothetical protein [Saprospiraceae bacterium]